MLYTATTNLPDVAFLRIKGTCNRKPLTLAISDATKDQKIGVIGYPTVPHDTPQTMTLVFDNIFGVKRMSPGLVLQNVADNIFFHDASTLRGSSGSPVLDLKTGHVVGLHYFGEVGCKNYAVAVSHLNTLISNKVI